MHLKPNLGEIWLANLNPQVGTEPGKTRPVFIIQTQTLLDINHPSTLVIPLTTNIINDAQPLRIRITAEEGIEKDSDLLVDQIRSIDNRRFVKGPLLKCSLKLIEEVQKAILEIIDYK